ncbi:MAG: 23S rRNA (uracil(1939)-C(5))-methyltransferase RlmD [Thermodesulfobacteriota bacterium]
MKEQVRTRIEKVVAGGLGLARLADGRVLLVPLTLPDEEVLLRLSGPAAKPTVRLTEITSPSPWRKSPPCPYFGRCGGCQLQHCDFDQQAELKKAIFSEQLQRAKIDFSPERLRFLAAPSPFHYRQRIRLQVKDGELGFFGRASHDLVAISEGCLLAPVEINQVLTQLLAWPHWDELAEQLSQLELHLDEASAMVVVRCLWQRKARPREVGWLKELAASLTGLKALLALDPEGRVSGPFPAGSDSLLSQCLRLPGLAPINFSFEAGGFCQVNQAQNRLMVEQVLAWLGPGENRFLLDLFCGMGNFSLPLAATGFQVHGVDLQRAAIRQARRNSQANEISCEFSRLSTAQAVGDKAKGVDVILLDPPRAGIKAEAGQLASLRARQIIYISCDAATLARDLKLLTKSYKIQDISLVDMFPQTAHMETMVNLLAR